MSRNIIDLDCIFKNLGSWGELYLSKI